MSSFENALQVTKKKTRNELTKKARSEKVSLIRDALKSDNIEISEDCVDVVSLKKELKSKLPDALYDNALLKIDGISNNLDNLLDDLENGSANSVQKFFKKSEKFVKPIAKATTFGLASRAAVILAPTVGSKLVVSGVLMANSTYKIIKNRKAGNVISQKTECNKILNELEITTDVSGVVTDTRFSDEAQTTIRDYLKKNNINYLDTGYLSLRQTIYDLDFERKKELCNILNAKLGKGIAVNNRIESKKKDSIFKSLKKTAASTSAGAAAGVGVAAAINSVDPAIMAGSINGTVLDTAISELTSSKSAGLVSGVAGTAGTAVLERIPFIGDTVKNFCAAENLLAGSVTGALVGAGVGVASILGAQAVKTIKNMHNQFSGMKEQKSLREFDSLKYQDDNKAELQKMQDVTLKSNTPEEQVLFNLVYEYMTDDLNVVFKETPVNFQQLVKCVESCDKKQKAKIHSFVGKLRECNNDRSDFVNTIAKVGYAAKTVATVGLAGLSALDILKDGTLLPEISSKLFKDVPNNIYLMIPEKPGIERIDYNGEITDRTDDYSMIENIDQAKENYKLLDGMKKEMTPLEQDVEELKTDFQSAGYDVKGDNIFETVYNCVKEKKERDAEFNNMVVENIREFFNSDHKLDTLVNQWNEDYAPIFSNGLDKLEEVSSDVVDTIEGKTVFVPDEEKIKATIDGLSENDLVDLAYYFNSSSDIDKTTETYQTIGNALQDKVDVITEIIEKYNNKMELINMTSKGATGAAVVSEATAGITDKKK